MTWRFVLARRAAVFAADADVPGPRLVDAVADPGAGIAKPRLVAADEPARVGEPRLVDAVVADAVRLDRARSEAAWAAVGRRVLRRPDLRALRSWQSVVWVLAVVPALAYLVVGGFPATRGLQQAMRGTVGLWWLVAAGVATTVLVAAQVPPLLRAVRAVADPSIHETRGRLQLRLGTASAGLVAARSRCWWRWSSANPAGAS